VSAFGTRTLPITVDDVRTRIAKLRCVHPREWDQAEKLNPATRTVEARVAAYEQGRTRGIEGLCWGHKRQHRVDVPCICGVHDADQPDVD
tara:strand:+ start:625 stop:894 length:270 start_codon:yes stop_codon:yes gene_type:complete